LFSLHVGLLDGDVPSGRFLEYTDDSIRQIFGNDFAALQQLPVLSMPEIGDDRHEQVGAPRDPSLVAVMMPFSNDFDVVYETIEQAATDAGLKCSRADDIWDHDHVMGDVLSLIWRSSIVIADLTGKNTNVFYETGLAHSLPRRTVLLTQNPSDVPFDLRSIRYLAYGLGTSERAMLRKQLAERLTTLAGQPLL
jgi:hypothetical protein